MALYVPNSYGTSGGSGFDQDNDYGCFRTVTAGAGNSGNDRSAGNAILSYRLWHSSNRLFELNSLRAVQSPNLPIPIKAAIAAVRRASLMVARYAR